MEYFKKKNSTHKSNFTTTIMTSFYSIRNLSYFNLLRKGMDCKIFFSMSSPSLAVISDAIKPGATALTYRK